MSMRFIVTDIEWDTDGEDVDLPSQLTIEIPDNDDDIWEEWDIEDYIGDEITDITGYCHFGFTSIKIK